MHCCDSSRDSEVLQLCCSQSKWGSQAEVAGKEPGYLQNCSALACRGVTLRLTQRASEACRVPERMLLQGFEGLGLKDSSSGKKKTAWYRRRQEARPGFWWDKHPSFPRGWGWGVGTYFFLTNVSFCVTWWLEHSQLCAFNRISKSTNFCNMFTLVLIYINRYTSKYTRQWASWCLGPTYWSIVSIPVESITYSRVPKQAVLLQWSLRWLNVNMI